MGNGTFIILMFLSECVHEKHCLSRLILFKNKRNTHIFCLLACTADGDCGTGNNAFCDMSDEANKHCACNATYVVQDGVCTLQGKT